MFRPPTRSSAPDRAVDREIAALRMSADAQLLPRGSGYMTDLGMCGPDDSVLGVRTDIIIEKLRTSLPARFEFAEGHVTLHGAVFDINTETSCVTRVERVAF